MKGILAVAERELRDRKMVFLAALLCAVLPFIVALTSHSDSGRREVISLTSAVLAVIFTLGLAVMLGVTIVGTELSQRRLSFYFSRPLAAFAIWWGKVVAALVMIFATFAIVFLPAFMVTGGHTGRVLAMLPGEGLDDATHLLIAALILFLITHVASTFLRSRSRLLAIDAVLALCALTVLLLITLRLGVGMAPLLISRLFVILAVAMTLILLGAGAWQLERGRADRVASHRALSRALWSALTVLLLAGGAYTWWVVSADPSDLKGVQSIDQARGGPWLWISGETKNRMDFHSGFLVNANDGKWRRWTPQFKSMQWRASEKFTPDGRNEVWIDLPWGNDTRGTLMMRPIEPPDSAVIDTGVPVDTRYFGTRFSDDSTLVAVQSRSGVAIYNVAERRSVGSFNLNDRNTSRLWFQDNHTLRLYCERDVTRDTATLESYEYDIPTRSLKLLGTAPIIGRYFALRTAADGSLLLLRAYRGDTTRGEVAGFHQLVVMNGRTLVTLSTPDVGPDDWYTTRSQALHLVKAVPLSGERVALVMTNGPQSVLRLQSADGGPSTDIALRGLPDAAGVATLANGNVLLASTPNDSAYQRQHTRSAIAVVDPLQGKVVHLEENLYRGGYYDLFGWGSDPRYRMQNPATPMVFMDKDSNLVRWDPITYERHALLKTGS